MIKGILIGINNVLALFFVIILIRCLLSWMPKLDQNRQPWLTIITLADSYLRIFRPFIPPLGGLDWSPTVAIIVLIFIQGLISGLISSM